MLIILELMLLQKLELMKVEEEARQTSLHASSSVSSWDMRKLQALQRRITQLYEISPFWIIAAASTMKVESA
jgi:hypothetical protein